MGESTQSRWMDLPTNLLLECQVPMVPPHQAASRHLAAADDPRITLRCATMKSMDEKDRKPFRVLHVVPGIVPEGHTITGDGWILPAPATAREVREAIQQSMSEVRQDVQQLRSEVLAAKSPTAASAQRVVVGQGVSQPAMIDTKACAKMLGLSIRSWQRLVKNGNAPAPVKLGRLTRWRLSDVEAFVTSRR